MTQITTIATPADLRAPLPGIHDHGMTLVHDVTGAERDWLHEVSIAENDMQATNYLIDAGYRQHCGWRIGGLQVWEYVKAYPLDAVSR